MLGPSAFTLLVLSCLLNAFAGYAIALPTNQIFSVRQDAGSSSQPVTVQTQDMVQTAAGPMMQTCNITMTPFTDPSGTALVREEKACTVTSVDAASNPAGSAVPAPSAASIDAPAPSPSADASASASAATQSPTPDASATPATAQSSASAAASPSASAEIASSAASATPAASAAASSAAPAESGVVANGVSAVPSSVVFATPSAAVSPSPAAGAASAASSASAAASSAPSPSASAETTTPSAANAAAGNPNPSVSASSTEPSGTSQADSASTSAPPAFQIPGKKLSVLPIGLAVFAGVSVIALIVVGLVTYERTKYRRAFRQRKLAESGAQMGYGGMAQAA